MNKIFNSAMKFLEMGIAIMPLYHRSKTPILSTWREFQTRLPSENELCQWFPTDWCNYAVIAGWRNLVIIDFDNMFYFDLWREWMRGTQYGAFGFQVRTRHGVHVYIRTETPTANDKRISGSGGIDVQAQGKYVVGPGCVHPSGHVYEAQGDFIFPVVKDVETILPLDLFPRVRADDIVFNGVAPDFAPHNTEYPSDPLVFSQMDLISKIKASVRIETLFTGVQRSSTDGRWLKALCPFHNDKHQSAWIDTVRQLCGCQVCGMKPMDAINLFAKTRCVSESVAVRMMAEEIGVWR